MENFLAVKFVMGYDKLMSFLGAYRDTKISIKVIQKVENRTWLL